MKSKNDLAIELIDTYPDSNDEQVYVLVDSWYTSKKLIETCFKKGFHAGSYPPHSMRHTTASHMLEAGVPLVVIKNFLGHASLQSTQIYAEISQDTVNRHLKEWNEKWFPGNITEVKTSKTSNRIPDFLN